MRFQKLTPLLALALAACGGADARPTPGVSGDTISIGLIVPLSDAVAVIGACQCRRECRPTLTR
jgi:hypothetical protein